MTLSELFEETAAALRQEIAADARDGVLYIPPSVPASMPDYLKCYVYGHGEGSFRGFPYRSKAHGRRNRKVEFAYLGKHAVELRQRYANEWIVLEGEDVIGHGPDLSIIADEARRRGIKSPLVYFVESPPSNLGL